jgi:putative transposase
MKISDDINFNSVLNRNESEPVSISNSIGIDVGCKGSNWIVDSNGSVVSLPDYTLENKKIKRLQRKLSRQIKERTNPEIRSNNSKKVISQIHKYYDRKINRRKSKLYDYINREIIDKNPRIVVIENLDYSKLKTSRNFKKSARNKINKQVYEASIYETHNIIQYMCKAHNIPIIKADAEFPSSQLCSNCGNRQKIGSKRVYKCPKCGLTIDRDLNAAINLANYSI